MRREIRLCGLMLLLSGWLVAACDHSPGPTNPVSAANTSISGSIVFSGVGTNVSSAGATVTAVGSGSGPSTTVDTNQSFTLSGVLPGSNVSLQFAGTGLNTVVPIGTLRDGDQITVTLLRTNNVLDLGDTGRRGTDGAEVVGRIDSIGTNQFVIGTQTIQTNPTTQFVRPDGTTGLFTDLNVGLMVTAIGSATSATTMIARTVQAQTPLLNTPVTLSGTIANLSGTFLSFQFDLQGRVVRGDTSTAFDSGRSFANLSNGVPVQVIGVTNVGGFVQASRITFQ